MGYFIDTIFNKVLSTQDKINRLELALSYDWTQIITVESWLTLQQAGLAPYVGECRWTPDFYPDPSMVGLDEYNQSGWNPLAAAIENNDMIIADWLLNHGADINKASENGKTPIFKAVECGYTEMLQFLYNRGANLLYKIDDPKHGIWLLEEAIRFHRVDIIQFMLSCPEINHVSQLDNIERSMPLAKALRAKSENKSALTEIEGMLFERYLILNKQKKAEEKIQSRAAVKIQSAFRQHRIETAYKAYINRPSIDALIESGDFRKVRKALSDIKAQSDILGLSKKVHFNV